MERTSFCLMHIGNNGSFYLKLHEGYTDGKYYYSRYGAEWCVSDPQSGLLIMIGELPELLRECVNDPENADMQLFNSLKSTEQYQDMCSTYKELLRHAGVE